MKSSILHARRVVTLAIGLLYSLLLSQADAVVYYWDPNGLSAPTSGTWDTTTLQWATTSALTATPIVWDPTVAAGFPAGTANISALTISVNSPIGFAGMFNGVSGFGATNLIINGSGSLSIASGVQGFSTAQSYYNTIIKVSLTGPGGLQNQASGSLYLAGANTYSGGTSIGTSAGLNFNNSSAFGTGTVTNSVATSVLATPANDSSGTAFATAPITIANAWQTFGGNNTEILVGLAAAPVTFSGPWTLTGAAGTTTTLDVRTTTWTISGPISGAANLTKINTATLLLSGANTYSGKTSINNGSVSVSSLNSVVGSNASSSLGAPTTVANGTINLGASTTAGTLLYTGAGETTDRVINLAGTTAGGTIQNDGTGPLVFSSDLTATGAGVKTLTLQGANTGNNTISGKIVNSSAATSVTKSGNGTWTLAGANTYTGNTTLNTGGRLNLANASAMGTGTFVIGGNGSFDNTSGADLTVANAFGLTGGSPTYVGSANKMTINGAVNVNNNRTITVSANILTLGSPITQDATPRNFTKGGAGTLVLAGGAAYTGNTTVSGGTLVIGGSGQMGAGNYAGTMADNGTFNYSSSAAQTLAGVISGTGTLVQNGSGTLKLSAINTYSGSTTVAGGTLDISPSGSLIASTVTVASSATLQLDSNTALGSAVNLLLSSGSPAVNLNFIGTDQIQLLSFDGGVTFAPAGIYGSIGSGATFQDARFTGPGLLAAGLPAAVAVTPSANPATYGDTVTLTASVSGPGPTPTGTVTFKEGLTILGSQTLDGTGSAAIFTNGFSAGTHSITVAYSGDVNYQPSTSPTLALVVNKAALSVTASNQSKVYGQSVTFGSGSTAFSSTALQNGETIGTVTLACAGGDATAPVSGSPYAITPSAATGGTFNPNNYAITYNNGTLTVSTASLTVTATGLLVYGSDPTNTIYFPQYTPLQGTDTVAVISGAGNFSTDATSSNYVGSNYIAHVVDTGTLSSPNYVFAAGADGVLTITNRPLTVTNVIANDKVYDGTTAATLNLSGAGLDGLVNGDETSVSLVTTSATGTFNDRTVGVGKIVSVTGLTTAGDLGTNYFLIQPTATANITKRLVTVTSVSDTRLYDGTTNSAGTPVASPPIAPGDTPSFSQAFDTKNAGIGKTLSPSGFVDDSNDGVNYALTFASVTTGEIDTKPITVTAVTDSKVYDGTVASAGIPTIAPALITGDTPNFSQVFNNKNVGTGKSLIPSGSVNDGNTGGNYAVTFVNDTTGAITAKAITVAAVTDSKVYDGTTNSTAVPTIAPGLAAGDTSGFFEAYDTKNVGVGKTLTPSGAVNDGNSGANYSVTFANDTSGSITAMGITVTSVATTKVYDGTTSSVGDPTIAPFLAVGDVSGFIQTYDTKNTGGSKTLTPSGSVQDGNGGANYSVTFFNNSNGIITKLATTNLLVSSANPSALGSNVTFTFTVNGNPPASDLPTGAVVFFDAVGSFATNLLVNGSCSASRSTLPVGTNVITAVYVGDNGPANFDTSSGTLNQVVTNSVIYSITNTILSILSNNDGTFTLNLLGTPGAQYYIVSSADITLPLNSWSVLSGSTNTATTPDGFWSFVVSNAAPVFYRSAAINPSP